MRLPYPGSRTFIAGRTGSGKTFAGIFLLSLANWTEVPWIVFDYKGDENIAQIPGATVVDLSVDLFKLEPGIYIVRPMVFDKERVEALLWNIWKHENIGLYIDEGYMLPDNSDAFTAILTQGRSKKITVYTLSQRPVGVTRFAISEANFFQIFHLNDRADRKRVQDYVPADLEVPLPEYHSIWYDADRNELQRLAPVPQMSDILAIFQERLPAPVAKRKAI